MLMLDIVACRTLSVDGSRTAPPGAEGAILGRFRVRVEADGLARGVPTGWGSSPEPAVL